MQTHPFPRYYCAVLLSAIGSLITVSHAESVVVFNELNYNPSGTSEEGEWIELHNQMAIDTDLSNWTLDDGVSYTFPEGTIIPSGGYVIVAKNTANPRFPNNALVLGPYDGFLSNGGERVQLLSSADRLMDQIDWEDSGDWPVSPDGGGVTLAKRQPGLISASSENWTASAETGGTPGAANFDTSDAMDSGLVINEVAGAGDASFFVEIRNIGENSINTDGYSLFIEGDEPASIALSNTNLLPGEYLLLDETSFGQRPSDGDKLFLRSPGATSVTSAQEVTNRLRGFSEEHPGKWIFPDAPTPGAANSFNFNTDIVINEICYHPPLLASKPGTPPTVETTELVNENAVWRFNEAGDNLGATWSQSSHPVGGNWESGAAIIGNDPGFPFPIATLVDPTGTNNPYVITYYFETDFSLSPEQANDLTSLTLMHIVDDGAVFYLNGTEIHRVRMPDGSVSASTLASTSINVAEHLIDRVEIPEGLAVAGVNRISVEVHQSSTRSGDIIFGLEVKSEITTDPGIPTLPRRESEEQWLEIYNRGSAAVDLSDWDFSEGIDFTFPEGTSLEAGEYLVVAKDPASVLAAHPGARVIGPYSGSLSRGGETLTLRDDFNNPADTLNYVDGGSWPATPDGGGSTLELIDPSADNSLPGAWAASDELARTSWKTYTYRGIANASPVGPDGRWQEFILGLLEEGEVLLDDITVIEDPDGSAVPMISDGTFENGGLGGWRARGTHRQATVIPDPDGGGNVLRLVATGSTEHMHNNLEITLANNRSVVNGREYEISFRARLVSGTNLLNSRLYFNRLPFTTELDRPTVLGTPGSPNSSLIANLGPTGKGLIHSPPVPARGKTVTVRAELTDPQGIDSATLYYSVNGGAFQQTAMSASGSGSEYIGEIPGQNDGVPVQFYVEATDTLGAATFLPADGPESRAMYEVEDGRAVDTGIQNIRIVMDPDDLIRMHTLTNVMSNDRIPCTVISGENKIHYNAGVRLKGSQRGRHVENRVGFNIAFPKDDLFRGVHRTIAIDRSEGSVVGQRELLFDLMTTSSRGIPGEFNDLCYVISPDPVHTSPAILQIARFGSEFLDTQFENGADGTVYEYELVYYPTTADAQNNKLPTSDRVEGTTITSLGSNPENYRWNYLIKNNQEADDLSGILDLVNLFDSSGTAFNQNVEEVLDVEQWLRALAYSAASGAGDSFFSNSRHNGQFYARPDGKILYFQHDMDRGYDASRDIFQNRELQKLIADPARKRSYLGHLHDVCITVYNQSWMQRWTDHFDELVPGSQVFDDDLSYINTRSNNILSQINSEISPVNFSITTNGGANFTTSSSPVELQGTGWINIRELRLAGSENILPVEWITDQTWQVSIPLTQGANQLTIEAYDFSGNLVGSDSITVTSTAGTNLPSADSLVISEIFYNPPGSDESSEYIELLNISPSTTLDLTGTAFVEGIEFTFPTGTEITPGGRLLVVSNPTEFTSMFGADLPVAGAFSGSLSNGGEMLSLTLPDGSSIQTFSYDDSPPWPVAADGDGFSLVLLEPESAPNHNIPLNWRASAEFGGSPGTTDSVGYQAWKDGFGNPADDSDDDGDGWSVFQEYYLGGTPTERDNLSPNFDFDFSSGLMTVDITRFVNAEGPMPMLYRSTDLRVWLPIDAMTLLSNDRLSTSTQAVDRLTWSVPLENAPEFFRFEIEED